MNNRERLQDWYKNDAGTALTAKLLLSSDSANHDGGFYIQIYEFSNLLHV
jgi:hypothetical protein